MTLVATKTGTRQSADTPPLSLIDQPLTPSEPVTLSSIAERPAPGAAQHAVRVSKLPTFSQYSNQRRVWGDKASLCTMLVLVTSASLRYGGSFSPLDALQLAVCSGVMAGCVVWAARAPRSYSQWRELASGLLRISFCALQASTIMRTAALQQANPWQHGAGLAAHLVFLGELVYSTKVLGLLQWALASRLCLPLHAMAQGVAVALSMRSIPQVCGCTVLQQGPSHAVLHRMHVLLDCFTLPFNYGGAAAPPASPTGECWAVMAMLQVCVGYVLPTVVIAVWECEEFGRFRQLARGRHQPSWGTWLYERATNAPPEGGWVRGVKLGLVSWSLFGGVWGALRLAAER